MLFYLPFAIFCLVCTSIQRSILIFFMYSSVSLVLLSMYSIYSSSFPVVSISSSTSSWKDDLWSYGLSLLLVSLSVAHFFLPLLAFLSPPQFRPLLPFCFFDLYFLFVLYNEAKHLPLSGPDHSFQVFVVMSTFERSKKNLLTKRERKRKKKTIDKEWENKNGWQRVREREKKKPTDKLERRKNPTDKEINTYTTDRKRTKTHRQREKKPCWQKGKERKHTDKERTKNHGRKRDKKRWQIEKKT